MRTLCCLETSPSDYPVEAASYSRTLFLRPICHYCSANATHQYSRSPRQHAARNPYQQMPDLHQNNKITGCSFYSCLTAWRHYCTKYVGRNSVWHWKLCSTRLITNPVNHKQNTGYSPHKRNVLYMKLAHSSHLQVHFKIRVQTWKYISKFGSCHPCSLVGDGHFGEHAVFIFRKAVTKVTLLRIFTACRLNSSIHHKNQATQQTRRTFLSLLESQIRYHLQLL
jgi:hypothetical protein